MTPSLVLLLALKVGTHDAEDAVAEIVTPRDALQYLMTNAAMDLPMSPLGVVTCADDVHSRMAVGA